MLIEIKMGAGRSSLAMPHRESPSRRSLFNRRSVKRKSKKNINRFLEEDTDILLGEQDSHSSLRGQFTSTTVNSTQTPSKGSLYPSVKDESINEQLTSNIRAEDEPEMTEIERRIGTQNPATALSDACNQSSPGQSGEVVVRICSKWEGEFTDMEPNCPNLITAPSDVQNQSSVNPTGRLLRIHSEWEGQFDMVVGSHHHSSTDSRAREVRRRANSWDLFVSTKGDAEESTNVQTQSAGSRRYSIDKTKETTAPDNRDSEMPAEMVIGVGYGGQRQASSFMSDDDIFKDLQLAPNEYQDWSASMDPWISSTATSQGPEDKTTARGPSDTSVHTETPAHSNSDPVSHSSAVDSPQCARFTGCAGVNHGSIAINPLYVSTDNFINRSGHDNFFKIPFSCEVFSDTDTSPSSDEVFPPIAGTSPLSDGIFPPITGTSPLSDGVFPPEDNTSSFQDDTSIHPTPLQNKDVLPPPSGVYVVNERIESRKKVTDLSYSEHSCRNSTSSSSSEDNTTDRHEYEDVDWALSPEFQSSIFRIQRNPAYEPLEEMEQVLAEPPLPVSVHHKMFPGVFPPPRRHLTMADFTQKPPPLPKRGDFAQTPPPLPERTYKRTKADMRREGQVSSKTQSPSNSITTEIKYTNSMRGKMCLPCGDDDNGYEGSTPKVVGEVHALPHVWKSQDGMLDMPPCSTLQSNGLNCSDPNVWLQRESTFEMPTKPMDYTRPISLGGLDSGTHLQFQGVNLESDLDCQYGHANKHKEEYLSIDDALEALTQ